MSANPVGNNARWSLFDRNGDIQRAFAAADRDRRHLLADGLIKQMPQMDSGWYQALHEVVADLDDRDLDREYGLSALNCALEAIERARSNEES